MGSSTDLEMILENRAFLLEESLARIQGGPPAGGLMFDVSFHYRILAIASLLLHADQEEFRSLLVRSGQAREYYLRNADRSRAEEGRFLCCSANVALDGLLAAGDMEGAKRLARLAPTSRYPDSEYPEDFLFRRILHAIVVGDPAAVQLDMRGALSELQAQDTETSGAKAQVALALTNGDQPGFDHALTELVSRRQERFLELAETPGFSKEHLQTERHVFLHGLALLRLAEGAGLDTALPLPTIPALARLPVREPGVEPDAWRRMPPSGF